MESVYIIIASQEYETSNHKNLWAEIKRKTNSKVIVFNIPADYCVSFIKRKIYRVREARNNPFYIDNGLIVLRPLFFIRPEILPVRMLRLFAKQFWSNIKKVDPEIFNKKVHIISYNPRWIHMLVKTHPNISLGYYLYDELRNNGHDGSIDHKTYIIDELACKESDVIYTMTQVIAESRKAYNSNIVVLGNGSIKPMVVEKPILSFPRAMAFIGNFRNWIDEALLSEIIKKRRDILFAFVGSIEKDMISYFKSLLDDNINTIYFGTVNKSDMPLVYQMFSGVIVPYKNNSFIRATRPIKIVEAVMAGIPVVTVPVDGFHENDYVRFATNVEEFSNQIDFVLSNPINQNSSEYIAFVKDNLWETKASVILNKQCDE